MVPSKKSFSLRREENRKINRINEEEHLRINRYMAPTVRRHDTQILLGQGIVIFRFKVSGGGLRCGQEGGRGETAPILLNWWRWERQPSL